MAIIRGYGVWWLDKALEAAERRDIAVQVSAIAADYVEGAGTYAVNDDPAGGGRVRVTRNGIGAVIGEGDVVIGYVVIKASDWEAHDGERKANGKPAGMRRASGMSGPSRRGPSDFAALKRMLRDGGYTVTAEGGGHLAVRDSNGTRVYTLPASASDHRSLANAVADLRTLTGLELRG